MRTGGCQWCDEVSSFQVWNRAHRDSLKLTSKSNNSLNWTPPPPTEGAGRLKLVEESWNNLSFTSSFIFVFLTWMTDIIVSRTGSFSFWFFPSLETWRIHFNSFAVCNHLISISSWRICSAPSLSAGDNTVCSWGFAFLDTFFGTSCCFDGNSATGLTNNNLS